MLIVTGATGLLGNTLVRRALARGLDVTVLMRRESPLAPLAGLPVRMVRTDLATAPLEPILDQARCVVHAAARVAIGRRDEAAFRQDNVVPTRRLAAACRATGTRLAFISSVDTLAFGTKSAPGDENHPIGPEGASAYARSKRDAEAVIAAEAALGLDAVVLHPGFLIGPYDWKPSSGRLLLAAAKAPFILAPPGGNDFCHAADVADGVLDAALHARPGSRYVLGGEALSYAEAFRLIRHIARQRSRVMTAPAWLLRLAGRGGDLVAAVTGREPAVNSVSMAIAVAPHHFSSALAMREIGYRPRPAEIAMREAWSWFVENGYA